MMENYSILKNLFLQHQRERVYRVLAGFEPAGLFTFINAYWPITFLFRLSISETLLRQNGSQYPPIEYYYWLLAVGDAPQNYLF